MRRAAWRYLVCAIALLASWWLLLLWAADAQWSAPFSPQARQDFNGSAFQEVFGHAEARDDQLAVQAASADYSTLQTLSVNVDAPVPHRDPRTVANAESPAHLSSRHRCPIR